MGRMSSPTEIDGAKVLAIATVEAGTNTGSTRHVRGGELVNGRIERLALAQYADQPGVYLFYCDEEWTVITDTLHDDIAAALDQAHFEFRDLTFVGLEGHA